ncbi:murein L,D-transpeptidase catalytic domain family protein, partial [Elusimicrobiota bacterium]
QRRLYVINLKSKKLLHHTLVAHGENSGEKYVSSFSNEYGSGKNSLGFYTTAETYMGKHGYSLKLDGREAKYNGNVRRRVIALHGSNYATWNYLRENGVLGKSEGCPSVPRSKSRDIIDSVKNGSCFFVYYNDNEYLKQSKFLNAEKALNRFKERKILK